MKKIIGLYLFLFCFAVRADDTILVHNKTELPLYAALYNVESLAYSATRSGKAQAKRYTEVKEIDAAAKADLLLPKFKVGIYREMALSFNPDDLKESLATDQFYLLPNQNIGLCQGYNFYVIINPKKGNLKVYNTAEWNVLKPVQDKLNKAVSFLSNSLRSQLQKVLAKNTPHIHKIAEVRLGSDVGPEEKTFTINRLNRVREALSKFLNKPVSTDLRIAICGSGGGYRAMLSTGGFESGLEQIGLRDAVLYEAGLSGSTWFISLMHQLGLSATEVKEYLRPRLNKDLKENFQEMGRFSKELLLKYSYNQPLSLVDPYGALIGWSLLKNQDNNIFKMYLSEQAKKVNEATVPLPIYTGVSTKLPYEWVEFTPYEVGSDYLGGYVPTWSFGRKFAFGKSIDNAPELPLCYLMGLWGSAFGVNFDEIIKHLDLSIRPQFLKTALEKAFYVLQIGKQRVYPAEILNFTLGIPRQPRYQQTKLTLIDAGIDFNLPLPPLLRKARPVDIIFIFDASAGNMGEELKKAQEYFDRKRIPFPYIDVESIRNNICTIIKDEAKPDAPVLIYMPLIKNAAYDAFDPAQCPTMFCSTFNFKWSEREIGLVMDLTKHNMVQSKELIANAIKDVLARKEKGAGQ